MRTGAHCFRERLLRALAAYRAEIGAKDVALRWQREGLGTLTGRRVLEIGAGAGNVLSMEIARASREYLAVDRDGARIGKLAEKLESEGLRHARAVERDLLEDGWPFGAFDVVYAGSVLHAFADGRLAGRVLREKMNEGAVLVAWEPLAIGWVNRLGRALHRPFRKDRKWHYPLTERWLEGFGKELRLEWARGLLGWSRWAFPLYLVPGLRAVAVRLGRWLFAREAGQKDLRGFHQAVLVWRKVLG